MSSANWDELYVNGKKVIRYKNQTDFVELTEADSKYLNSIKLPFALVLPKCKEIPENFIENDYIEFIKFQEGLEEIQANAFLNCSGLKKINTPNSLKKIGDVAFAGCQDLKRVELKEGLLEIGRSAFYGCSSLEELAIPQSVETLGTEFFNACKSLNSVHISETQLKQIENLRTNKLVVNGQRFNSDKFKIVTDEVLGCLVKQFTFEELQKINIARLKTVCKKICGSNLNEVDNQELYEVVQYLSYMLGVLSPDEKLSEQAASLLTTAYDGKVQKDEAGKVLKDENGETVITKFEPSAFMDSLVIIFENSQIKMNPDMVKFYTMNKGENFYKLIKELNDNPFLFQQIYDNFDEAVQYNVSNNAQARQLIPTIEFFKKYIESITSSKFVGVTKETDAISSELSKFTSYTQSDFDLACKVYFEYLKMVEEQKKNNPNYEDVALKESKKTIAKNAFNNIDRMSEQINENLIQATSILGQTIDQEDTWEWLSHKDPLNFTLGHYCSCCAKIQGAGEGIAFASVKLPNVRNLVIKNKAGMPIAKSTIYVNVEQGYAVLNNVEVKESITQEQREKIYYKLMEAINAFVTNYNLDAQARGIKPLEQVNMGMHLNDLKEQIERNHNQGEILQGINFGDYGVNANYNGDWKTEQRVMWSQDVKNEKQDDGLTVG